VDDVQRHQRHPRLEVQLAERGTDDAGRRGEQLAGVDHQHAARPAAEQLAGGARGVIVHPAFQRAARSHREKRPLTDHGSGHGRGR
jgi:hypothetical protein